MNYHKLLQRQINKYLPQHLKDDKDLKQFLKVVEDSYLALQRDKILVERAFEISEEEYLELNSKLQKELNLKRKTLEKLKETAGIVEGNDNNEQDDLLEIINYLNLQVSQRKNAEVVFTSLINNTQSCILLEDEERKIVFCNQLFCDLFQIPVVPEYLKGADCSQSAEQSKHFFKNPEAFVKGIVQVLKNQSFKSETLELADGRILRREYIPIFIENQYKGHLWNYTDITEKLKVEEAIKSSELKNRLIMNAALDAIITIDKKGLITFWNPQAEKIFGWSEKEVLGKSLNETIIPRQHHKGHENGMKNYEITGHGPVLNKIIELPAVNRKGEEFPIELSVIPIQHGETEFFCSFIRDISNRKKNEQALKESQELWQFALEGAGDGVWEYNFQTKEVFFSKQYKKMLGFKEEEFKNEPEEWRNRIHPDDLHLIDETDEDYRQNKITTHQREYRIKHKDGHYIWILDRGMVINYTHTQEPNRIIGTHTDITERKISEQALKIREQKYRSILANMNLGLLEVDNHDLIQYANQSFCLMSGYTLEEILGEKASDLFLDENNRNTVIDKNSRRKKGLSDAYELPIVTKTGKHRWWLISGAPRYNDQGELVGSIGIHLDITAQKQLEADLRKAKDEAEASKEAKEAFLANMSHEIRTPMNAILGMSNQLKKTKLNTDQKFFLDTINTSAENLLIIINDILDLSKIESGKLGIEKIGFETKKLIDHLMQVMKHRAEEKGLSFTNSLCDHRLSKVFLGDPYRIEQVMLNFVSNAIKFTNKGGVDIKCKVLENADHHQTMKFSVLDTGIGMDEEFVAKLFDAFSQEDSSISRKYGGTGLGMRISKQLIELMGGQIQVETKKNKGTEVSFTITLEKGTEADLPQREIINADTNLLRGKSILITDDNEINRLLASTILENFGANIYEAANGKEAINLLKEVDLDLILMDVQMPVMDGMEATKTIRKNINPTIPIIALTAFALKGDNQKCFDVGMNDYLSKPFEEAQLLQLVAKWLGARPDVIKEKDLQAHKEQPTYSLEEIYAISRGNHDFVVQMVNLFTSQTPVILNDMIEAYEAKDFEKLSRLAHKLKPSVGNLKITSIIDVIKDVEKHATKYQQSEVLEKKVNQIVSVLEQVMVSLKENEI